MKIPLWSQLHRPIRLILVPLTALLLCLAVFPKSTNPNSPHPLFGQHFTSQGFHFLLPAAKSDPNLCRAVLSSAASGYPDPVLLGWEGRGLWNGSESKLFRISETLAYFRSLRKTQDSDLVLLADAQESLFQLPPEIAIRRYRLAMDKNNARLKDQKLLGKKGRDSVPVGSSVLLGATNRCWPVDASKGLPACNVTFSGIPSNPGSAKQRRTEPSLGFLHGGAIMGTVKDIRELFLAVMTKIDDEFNDDFVHRHETQHYLTMVWEDQESARARLRTGKPATDGKDQISRSEFGIALDHDGDVILTSESMAEPIAWLVFDQPPGSKEFVPGRRDSMQLAKEIKALGDRPLIPVNHTWEDMRLGTNMVNGVIFPVAQVSSKLSDSNGWWSQFWFQIHPEATHKAARQRHLSMTVPESSLLPQPENILAEVRNIKYMAAQGQAADPLQAMRSRDKANLKGGVWNDVGEYMTWDEVCKPHEAQVYNVDT